MFDKTVDLGTDIAALFVYHPDTLAYHENDPLDWWTYDFSCRPDFAAGRMLAFRTGGDGGYRLRFTDGRLTNAEEAAKAGAWTFGFVVDQERVFVDNGNSLPCTDKSADAASLDEQWAAVPNGKYKVTVQAIDRSNVEDEKVADELPDYVLIWEPTAEDMETLAKADVPPSIEPIKGKEPFEEGSAPADGYPTQTDSEPLEARYLFLKAEGLFLIPGSTASYPISEELYERLGGNRTLEEDAAAAAQGEQQIEYMAAASSDQAAGTATLGRITGYSRLRGEPARITLRGERLLRTSEPTEQEGLTWVKVEPVEITTTPLAETDAQALKAAWSAYVAALPEDQAKTLGWEVKRVEQMSASDALVSRLIELVRPPAALTADILTLRNPERARKLLAFLKDEQTR